MTETLDYALYGLPGGNPYVNRELDPSREADTKLFLPLEVLPGPEAIEGHIRATKDETSAFRSTAFLLSGRAGAGRSTLARMIFHRYQQAHDIKADFHIVRFSERGHDSLARINKIIKALRNEVIRRHWDKRAELLTQIPDAEDLLPEEYDLQGRADFVSYVASSVTPPMHLGLLINGVQEDAFMDLMAEVFRHVPAVIVITRDAYRTPDTASQRGLNERQKWREWAKPLELRPLAGSDVELLTANRWHAAAGDDVECPFELAGVRSTFDRRKEPIGRAIRWLAWLLDGRLERYEGTQRWPDAADLRLPAKWIESEVQRGERAPRDVDEQGHHGK